MATYSDHPLACPSVMKNDYPCDHCGAKVLDFNTASVIGLCGICIDIEGLL